MKFLKHPPELPHTRSPKKIETECFSIRVSVSTLASSTHPKRNEDNHVANMTEGVFAVFDGIGGYKGGQIASQLAAATIADQSKKIKGKTPEEVRDRLLESMKQAAEKIVVKASLEPKILNMGTTATVVKIWSNNNRHVAIVAHVGDSRAYVWKKGKLQQITFDHTLIIDDTRERYGEEVARRFASLLNRLPTGNDEDIQALSADDRAFLKENNLEVLIAPYFFGSGGLNRCSISKELRDAPNNFFIDVDPGDKILLTTDGVHDNLDDEEIRLILDGREMELADNKLCKALSVARKALNVAETLVMAARIRSKQDHARAKEDDATAIVVEL